MKKLSNPFNHLEGYNCFGCSDNNSQGLQMEFYEDGEEILCTWDPKEHYQGYMDILHGGIQSTLMDEIASWVVFIKLRTGGVTSRLNTRFKRPVRVSHGKITVRARLVEKRGRIAEIGVELFNGKGELCSESTAEYFVLSPEKARETMQFPDMEAFYQ